MTLLTTAQREQVAEQIADVERHTNAELVTVLAARSDDYHYIPVLWAALVSLTVPSLALLAGVAGSLAVVLQLGVFCALTLLLQIPQLRTRLIPRRVGQWRAANMARRQFLELGLHDTRDATGVLIFVSEAEHYVEILADRGINQQVPAERWEGLVADFVAAVRAGQPHRGFETAITQIGEILAETVPKTADNRNELDDRLVLIGYD